MQLTIESVKPTKTGKSLVVKAGGKEYMAKKDSGLNAGMTIDAELKDSEYGGKLFTWIEKWKAMAATTVNPVVTAGTSVPHMPFVSNVVAHAISAGLIQQPSQIQDWANAAHVAAVKLGTDIPF